MKLLLVSVIVPTKNSSGFIEDCLRSIKLQTYKNIELIVVDNFSIDETLTIAKKYTDKIYSKGSERSAQRNFGASNARGDFVMMIDSDMTLTPRVIEACVHTAKKTKAGAIIILEQSFGIGFWAQCKQLERSFYMGIDTIEAARFFDSSMYHKLGGYEETMVSGEDWDLSNRFKVITNIERVSELIMHNEGHLKLRRTLRKKYYYASLAKVYLRNNDVHNKLMDAAGPLQRYKLFFSQPIKLFRHPIYGFGMLFMKTSEYAAGGLGFALSNHRKIRG